jgi:hypothetical protein
VDGLHDGWDAKEDLNELKDNARSRQFDDVAARVSSLAQSLGSLIKPIKESDGLNVDSLRTVVDYWSEIFESAAAKASFVLAPSDTLPALINDTVLDDVSIQLQIVRSYLEKLSDVGGANSHVGALYSELTAALRRAKHADFGYLPDELNNSLQLMLTSLRDRLDLADRKKALSEYEERVTTAVAEAETSASAASSAAGLAGDAAMSSYYQELAESEKTSANTFRWLTTFLALVAGGFAAAFALGPAIGLTWLELGAGDYVHLIQRALLVGGMFGLAGYFARQAHQHRSMANWASALSVQLKTFESYISSIADAEVKNELRKSFAARVFGEHPAMKGEPSVAPTAELGEKAIDLASKVVGR